MPRDFKSRNNNTLKNIAQKSNMSDTIVLELNINDIVENPDNEKIFSMEGIEHLAQGIEEKGFNVPIEVFKLENGKYEICSGHRRYRAMKSLGKETIKAIVSENVNDTEKAERLLDGNIFNRKLSPMDFGRAIRYYKEKVLKPKNFKGDIRKAVAEKFNISDSQVFKYEAILDIIPEVQSKVEEGILAFSAVTPMANLSIEMQEKINNKFDEFLKENGENSLTRGMAQKIIAEVKEPKTIEKPPVEVEPIQTHENRTLENDVDVEVEDDVDVDFGNNNNTNIEIPQNQRNVIEVPLETEIEDEEENIESENENNIESKVEQNYISADEDIDIEDEDNGSDKYLEFNNIYKNTIILLSKKLDYESYSEEVKEKLKKMKKLIENEIERLE